LPAKKSSATKSSTGTGCSGRPASGETHQRPAAKGGPMNRGPAHPFRVCIFERYSCALHKTSWRRGQIAGALACAPVCASKYTRCFGGCRRQRGGSHACLAFRREIRFPWLGGPLKFIIRALQRECNVFRRTRRCLTRWLGECTRQLVPLPPAGKKKFSRPTLWAVVILLFFVFRAPEKFGARKKTLHILGTAPILRVEAGFSRPTGPGHRRRPF